MYFDRNINGNRDVKFLGLLVTALLEENHFIIKKMLALCENLSAYHANARFVHKMHFNISFSCHK